MTFRHSIRIGFNHCDPAGIVFYPRYFEMTNTVMETFFREVVGVTYEAMMADRAGVPTARIEADFRSPGRLGEVLDWDLSVTRVGTASAGFRLDGTTGGVERLRVLVTLVNVVDDGAARAGRPLPWDAAVRDRLATHLVAA